MNPLELNRSPDAYHKASHRIDAVAKRWREEGKQLEAVELAAAAKLLHDAVEDQYRMMSAIAWLIQQRGSIRACFSRYAAQWPYGISGAALGGAISTWSHQDKVGAVYLAGIALAVFIYGVARDRATNEEKSEDA